MPQSESPFETVNRIVNEVVSPADDLRIMAHDHQALKADERELLRAGADEIDQAQRAAATYYARWKDACAEVEALRVRVPAREKVGLVGSMSLRIDNAPTLPLVWHR